MKPGRCGNVHVMQFHRETFTVICDRKPMHLSAYHEQRLDAARLAELLRIAGPRPG